MKILNPKPWILNPALLGGSWVVKDGVISRATIDITHITGLITPIITLNPKPLNPKPLNPKPLNP